MEAFQCYNRHDLQPRYVAPTAMSYVRDHDHGYGGIALPEANIQMNHDVNSDPDADLLELQSLVELSASVYSSDGVQYDLATFRRYYGDDEGWQQWLIGQKVTAGTLLILSELADQESQIMRRSLEYQNLKDSMDIVTWWCHQRSSPFADTELERPSNVEVFLKLANSVALLLWYRELQLMESEDPSTVLDLDRGKAAWTAWKDMFCKTQLT